MNAGSSLQSEGLRTDQMVPGVRTQPPPPPLDGWSVYGEWVREGSVEQGGGIASEWTGVGCDNGPDIQLYAQIVQCYLCCAAVVSVG